jgi:transcription antitermination factor NusG
MPALPKTTASPTAPGAAADRPLAEGQRWYVAQTIASSEFRAAAHLEAQRFRVFLPNVIRTVRHARQTRTVRSAAFPGYLFVALDIKRDRWRSINGTFGVSGLIASGAGAPLAAPHGVVETLFHYLDERGVCRFERDLVVGQSVRIISGPLAQAMGRLTRLDARGRVQVLLEILGGEIQVKLEKSALEAASDSACSAPGRARAFPGGNASLHAMHGLSPS